MYFVLASICSKAKHSTELLDIMCPQYLFIFGIGWEIHRTGLVNPLIIIELHILFS